MLDGFSNFCQCFLVRSFNQQTTKKYIQLLKMLKIVLKTYSLVIDWKKKKRKFNLKNIHKYFKSTYCGNNFIVSIIISAALKYSFAMWGSSQAALYRQLSPIKYPNASVASPSDTTFSESNVVNFNTWKSFQSL